jgi:hypothetical protein
MPEPKFFDEDTFAPVHGNAIADQAMAAAAPTKAEFDSLATKFNTLLAACRSAGLIAQD